MATTALDPFATFVHLHPGGAATTAPVTPTFWPDLVTGEGDRVVRVHLAFARMEIGGRTAVRSPDGDEVLCRLTGALDVVLEEPAGDRAVPLGAGQVFVVSRGLL